ncbi:hypothetical protein [Streptomyces odonnellii]|uniref:hypothetical protein n=1 Tax=Streptomyces odonnellii TaxID=1417980 RepID=UPI00062538CE|nr:hypothetical protein [Streptomyces odonnellii]
MADRAADSGGGADEVLLVRARRRVRGLVVLLEVAPFGEQTVAAMRAYLDEEAAPARDAFARWVALSPSVRAERVGRLREGLS